VINNWPESEQAMRARHRIFKADIDNNNFANLDAYIDRIVKDHATDEDFVDRVLSICNLFIRKNDPAMALPYINRALQASPNHDKVTLLLKAKAECYIGMGANEQAVVVIDRIVKDHATDEDFVDIVLSICNLFIRKNDPAMALPYINRALEVTTELKQSIMLLRVKAECYIDMGAEEQAQAVQEEIALYSEQEYYPGVQLGIADRYRINGEPEKAIEVYDKVLDSTTDKTQQLYAHVGTARSYFQLEDDPNVTATVDLLCKDFADHEKLGWGLYVIGEDYFLNNIHEHSKNVSLLGLKHDPNSLLAGESAYMIAHCARKLNDPATQMEYYHLVMEKYPRSQFAHRVPNELGQLYRGQRNYEQAVYWLTQQRELYKDRLFGDRATYNLAIVYAKILGDHAKAAEVFENYKEWYPSGTMIECIPIELAVCYDKLGKKPEATTVLNDALEKCSNINIVKIYRDVLSKIQKGAK
ncbi:MAG: tetratricopeptide repeat protein, partial [Planctomycetes bacterium]|nr:tetratricopeptide repeat protein [Planctomycetota bacterium]